jgi:putative CocE/NonD family hydrolase
MGHFYEDLYEGGVLEEDHLKSIRKLGFGLSERILAEPLSGSEFWKEGGEESRPQDLDVPLLFITGWYDLVTAQTIDFFLDLRRRGGPRAKAHSRLLIGPWHHTAVDQRRQGQEAFPEADGAATEATRAFLARWLDEDEGAPEEPAPIRYWQMGEERWVAAETWPPPGRRMARFHLAPGGVLGPKPPPRPGSLSYVTDPADPVPTVGGANLPLTLHAGPFDQREVEIRHDVKVFTTEVLADPVALCGRAAVTLTAVIDAVDADFAVRLTDVLPDGRSLLVCDSIRRARLRGSTDLPMPLFPGMEFEIRVTLPPVARTFLPGHRIRISVSGSNWPRFERNGHNGLDHFDEKDAMPATTTLRFGEGKKNEVVLPVK